MPTYDRIGQTYLATRRPDPRIAARIHAALGDVRTVANVGAGTGSYEPPETVVAVDPSAVMIAQRPAGAAPAVRAVAEAIPLRDGAVDAAMAVLTVHHWSDLEAGIAELRRVARRRIVILGWDHRVTYWLHTEYLGYDPATKPAGIPIEYLAGMLGGARIEPVPVPHDCVDGFAGAFWRRPEAYLDPAVRAGISSFAQASDVWLRSWLDRLRADLESGTWRERHADLLDLDELDLGYRLFIADSECRDH